MSPRAALAALCLALATACAPGAPAPAPDVAPPAADAPAPGTGPALADRSCRVAADCAVKNVGNCCGAMPACVNKDSAVDPAAVQSQCAKDGRAGVCGFREIESCSCNAGRCEAAEAFMPQQSKVVPEAES